MFTDRQPRTLLLVEDDRCLAQVLRRILSRSGFQVVWAQNAAAAVRQDWDDGSPTMALIDFHLPDGNGVDLAEILEARFPSLPMIMMTGYAVFFRDRPVGAERFRQVLEKPLDLLQLRQAISAVLAEDTHANDRAACNR
jgi:two-component system response regulator GlrR